MRSPWILGTLIGTAVGLVVASLMSYSDWRLNPSGIFRDGSGTHWPVVLETAASWFVPVALGTAAITIPILVWRSSR